MTSSIQVSPITSYYLRKLCEQRRECSAPSLADSSNSVGVQWDFNQALKDFYGNPEQLAIAIQQLEIFVNLHRQFISDKKNRPEQIEELENKIFILLGWISSPSKAAATSLTMPRSRVSPELGEATQISITAEEMLDILNHLRACSTSYLGVTLTINYLIASRPDCEWLDQFQVHQSQPLTYTGSLLSKLTPDQVQDAKDWVASFIRSCTRIIATFPQFLDKKKLRKLMSTKPSS